VLSKDQRVLLKLKSQKFIPSSEDRPSNKVAKKKINKGALLDRYIETLMTKDVQIQDLRLLKTLGFAKVVELLNQKKEEELRAEEEKNPSKGQK